MLNSRSNRSTIYHRYSAVTDSEQSDGLMWKPIKGTPTWGGHGPFCLAFAGRLRVCITCFANAMSDRAWSPFFEAIKMSSMKMATTLIPHTRRMRANSALTVDAYAGATFHPNATASNCLHRLCDTCWCLLLVSDCEKDEGS